ncbi:response regulator transcription factor [Cellulosimicrobium sp. PMB13]|uniref:response regulator n=1 Tax=Cellulosimicrobium sp. PMB13 TaxID=3120158 RepID=UPI003F4C35F3
MTGTGAPVGHDDGTPSTSTIRVLLVDDQALLRMGFRMILAAEDDIEVVGEAGDGATGIAQASALRPDVVLMDVRMPGTNGIEATERIVAETPSSRVIILTTFDLDEYAFSALRAGASGFLLKDAKPGELVGAIRAVASGDAAMSPRITRRMLEMFSGQLPQDGGAPAAAATGRDDPRLAHLTARELEVFEALGEGLTNAEIAGRFVLSEATVKTHVGRVLGKLGLRDRVQAVVLAYETGVARPS